MKLVLEVMVSGFVTVLGNASVIDVIDLAARALTRGHGQRRRTAVVTAVTMLLEAGGHNTGLALEAGRSASPEAGRGVGVMTMSQCFEIRGRHGFDLALDGSGQTGVGHGAHVG